VICRRIIVINGERPITKHVETDMPDRSRIVEKQLKQACQAAGARWAAWIKRTEGGWVIGLRHAFRSARVAALVDYLVHPKEASWIAGALSGGRMRFRSLPDGGKALGCRRLYVFPAPEGPLALLVGAGELDEQQRGYFKLLALNPGPFLAGQTLEVESPAGTGVALGRPSEEATYLGEQASRNLDLIHQVVHQIAGLTALPEIARQAAHCIAEFLNSEFIAVLLLDRSVGRLVAAGIAGSQAHLLETGASFLVEGEVAGSLDEMGWSPLCNDVASDPDRFSLVGWRAGSQICLPLAYGEQQFGLVDMESRQRDAFTDSDLLMFESLAGVLSSVMMCARRYEELQVLVSHLQAAQETGIDISSDLDLNVLLDRAVHRVRGLLGTRGAELALVDENQKMVEICISANPWRDFRKVSLPLWSGLLGRVAVLGKPLIVNDYRNWEGKYQEDLPFNSIAGVPLKYKDEVIGVLAVTDDRPGFTFNQEDIQHLELLAPQIAISIRSAQLVEELRQRIAAQQLAESRLVRSARLAAVGEMTAGVAHELNNPLTSVAGFVELALSEMSPESPHFEDLELVLKEARRAGAVVRQLLNFSRPLDLNPVPTDLNALIQGVIPLVQHMARSRQVQIELELTPDLLTIPLDATQIRQVLLNLLHNGLYAMEAGGALTVRTGQSEHDGANGLIIQVQDTGVGIPPENLERIFDPFFTTRPPGAGSGLGLWVSHGIINDHGGFIDVNSQVGDGTCFTIWLPLQPVEDLACKTP
jgi:two-component system, NtrC family, sensor kinase